MLSSSINNADKISRMFIFLYFLNLYKLHYLQTLKVAYQNICYPQILYNYFINYQKELTFSVHWKKS